ncbi:unnamed protein product [Sphagnum tenellum]
MGNVIWQTGGPAHEPPPPSSSLSLLTKKRKPQFTACLLATKSHSADDVGCRGCCCCCSVIRAQRRLCRYVVVVEGINWSTVRLVLLRSCLPSCHRACAWSTDRVISRSDLPIPVSFVADREADALSDDWEGIRLIAEPWITGRCN